jgi:Flp pilus assembly pilin Flp
MKTGHENRQRPKEASALRASFGCRGQQALEYALFIGAISLAFVVMFTYSKRGLQSVIKATADQIGPQEDSVAPWSVSNVATNSTASTLINESMSIHKVGGERVYDSGSSSISTAIATTWSESVQ